MAGWFPNRKSDLAPWLVLAGLASLVASTTGCAALGIFTSDEMRASKRADDRREQLLDWQRSRQAAMNGNVEESGASFGESLAEGDRLRRAGDLAKAYLAYLRAHWADPQHPGPPRRIAFLAIRLDPSRAVELFGSLIEESPNEASLQAGLGLAHLSRGDLVEARKALRTALVLDPDSAATESTLGVVYDRMGRHAVAQTHHEAARERDPGDARILNNLGVSYLLSEDHAQAAEAFQAAIARGGRDPALRNNLGLAFALLGRYDRALAAFRGAGTNGDALNNLGYALHLRGEYDRAVEIYERALLANDTDEGRVIENLTRSQKARNPQP